MTESEPIDSLVQAVADARDWTDAAVKLQGLIADPDDQAANYLVALEYMLNIEPDSDQQQRWGPFGPMMEMQGVVRPIPLDQAPDFLLDSWSDAVTRVEDLVVQSRFHDLLWIRKRDRADEHCRAAVEAYRGLGTGRWRTEYSGYLALGRALQLSRQLGDRAAISASIADLLSFTAAGIEERPPGRGLMAAELLADLPASMRPTREIAALAQSVVGREDMTIDLTDGALALLARCAPQAETKAEWQRRQVLAWLDESERSSGLIRAFNLDHAVSLAANYGLNELADTARSRLQGITDEELDLKTVSAQVNIPTDQAEAYVKYFVGDDSWQRALERFGARRAPAGDAAQNEQSVRDQMQRFPFQYLTSKRVMNSINLPIAIVTSPEEHFDVALREAEARSIGIWGVFAAPVLDQIKERYGEPSKDELTQFFTTAFIPVHIAERVARSFGLWWNDQPDEAAHLLLPRLEAIIREMARTAGLVIYREPHGHNRGGVRLLGAMLQELSGLLEESWRRHLVNLLTEELGYNLRNLVLHGLIPNVERVEAALLLNASCYLRLLKPQPIVPEPAEPEPQDGHGTPGSA